MKSHNRRIGDLIEVVDERNGLGIRDFYGINVRKEFMPTVANTVGLDETKYKVVRKGRFVYSGMQTGRDKCIRLSMYTEEKPIIVSPAYTTFEVVATDEVLPQFFFMWFLSKERDRLGWFYSDSSIRANLDWNVFCDIEITLPPINVQQQYVDIFEGIRANRRKLRDGQEDLLTCCFATIEKLRREMPLHHIGQYITKANEKNTDGAITLEQGINISKEFITPQRSNSNLSGRQIVRTGQFAYCTQLNNQNVAIAYRTGPDCVVSSVYDVFYIHDKASLLPEYLMLWLIREEFGRFVYWASEGSAYEFLAYENICNYRIPVPSLEVQESVSRLYRAYLIRKTAEERLRQLETELYPTLLKAALCSDAEWH